MLQPGNLLRLVDNSETISAFLPQHWERSAPTEYFHVFSHKGSSTFMTSQKFLFGHTRYKTRMTASKVWTDKLRDEEITLLGQQCYLSLENPHGSHTHYGMAQESLK